MRRSFFGGVNPAPYKESTRRKPIARLEYAPEQVVLPLAMSSEGDSVPAVKPGVPASPDGCWPLKSAPTPGADVPPPS